MGDPRAGRLAAALRDSRAPAIAAATAALTLAGASLGWVGTVRVRLAGHWLRRFADGPPTWPVITIIGLTAGIALIGWCVAGRSGGSKALRFDRVSWLGLLPWLVLVSARGEGPSTVLVVPFPITLGVVLVTARRAVYRTAAAAILMSVSAYVVSLEEIWRVFDRGSHFASQTLAFLVAAAASAAVVAAVGAVRAWRACRPVEAWLSVGLTGLASAVACVAWLEASVAAVGRDAAVDSAGMAVARVSMVWAPWVLSAGGVVLGGCAVVAWGRAFGGSRVRRGAREAWWVLGPAALAALASTGTASSLACAEDTRATPASVELPSGVWPRPLPPLHTWSLAKTLVVSASGDVQAVVPGERTMDLSTARRMEDQSPYGETYLFADRRASAQDLERVFAALPDSDRRVKLIYRYQPWPNDRPRRLHELAVRGREEKVRVVIDDSPRAGACEWVRGAATVQQALSRIPSTCAAIHFVRTAEERRQRSEAPVILVRRNDVRHHAAGVRRPSARWELARGLGVGCLVGLVWLCLLAFHELRGFLRSRVAAEVPATGAPVAPRWLRAAEVTHAWGRPTSAYRGGPTVRAAGPASRGHGIEALRRRALEALRALVLGGCAVSAWVTFVALITRWALG